MSRNDKERKVIHYVVDAGTSFSNGYSRSDITKEPHFGKYTEVLHIQASEETCREYERMEENERKRSQRACECQHKKEGRCTSTLCKGCLNYLPSKDGAGTLSLNQFVEENGDIFEDTTHMANPEEELDKKEFWATLARFKDSLTREERILAEGIINGTPDKELMKELGTTKQSTCSSRKQLVRLKMQIAMKDFKTL